MWWSYIPEVSQIELTFKCRQICRIWLPGGEDTNTCNYTILWKAVLTQCDNPRGAIRNQVVGQFLDALASLGSMWVSQWVSDVFEILSNHRPHVLVLVYIVSRKKKLQKIQQKIMISLHLGPSLSATPKSRLQFPYRMELFGLTCKIQNRRRHVTNPYNKKSQHNFIRF